LFGLQLILGIIVGGGWIAGTTLAAQRLGSRLGGFLSGLPSTMVVSLLFISWTQGALVAREATSVMPVALAVNAVLLLTFAALAQRGFAGAILTSMAGWGFLQVLVAILDFRDFVLGIAVCGVLLLLGRAYMIDFLGIRPVPGAPMAWSWRDALLRGMLSGGVVGAAMALTRFAGPGLGGVFAVFPAVILSTLMIAQRAAGQGFTRSLVPSFMTSMLVHCVVYAIVFRWSVLEVGPLWATAISYGGTLFLGAGTYRLFPAEGQGPRAG